MRTSWRQPSNNCDWCCLLYIRAYQGAQIPCLGPGRRFNREGDPVAIDNATCAYDTGRGENEARFATYLQAVRELTTTGLARARDACAEGDGDSDVLRHRVTSHDAMKIVRNILLEGQGEPDKGSYVPGLEYDIGDEGVLAVERGFLDAIN